MTTITESNLSQNLDLSQINLTLPPQVDFVVEYPDLESFPFSGRAARLYIALDSGLAYRWTPTGYVPAADLPTTYSDEPPAHPYTGQRWTTLSDLTTYEWFAGAWVEKPTNN